MSSQGPLLVASGVDLGASWISPHNITVEDAAYATAGMFVTTSVLRCTMSTNPFSVPSGNSILGVVVEFKIVATAATPPLSFVTVQLTQGGVSLGTNQASGNVPDTLQWVTFGSSVSLWNATLTDATVNSSTFGVDIAINDSSGSAHSVSIDAVRITVYYGFADIDVPADNKSALSQPSPNYQSRRFLGVQQLGGTPGPDSDDDANIINQRICFWNP